MIVFDDYVPFVSWANEFMNLAYFFHFDLMTVFLVIFIRPETKRSNHVQAELVFKGGLN